VDTYAHSAALQATPLDVGKIFQSQMAGGARAWVFTSATLSVNGDFGHYQREMGLADALHAHSS
jgi:ATP-dependent DNA helicase DinG